MRTTIKVLSAVALMAAFAQAPATFAAVPDKNSAVSKNFKQVGRSMRAIRSAETGEELADVLKKVKTFSVKNRELVPTVMEKESKQFADYQKGMDNFIAKLDEAIKLAEAGDVDGAKKVTSTFRDIKKDSHKYFNIERRK